MGVTFKGNVVLFSCVRNEELRLPYFLEYYRSRGISQMFIVDNASTDSTPDILASAPGVTVIREVGRYSASNYGTAWLRTLIQDVGLDKWCLAVDADELLVYPDSHKRSIPEMCEALATEGATALPAILLDMYSDRSIAETQY